MAGYSEKPTEDDDTQTMKQAKADTACTEAASVERLARAEMLHSLAKYIDVQKDRR